MDINSAADSLKRERSIEVSSGEYVYTSVDVDMSIDDWVVSNVEFTVENGLEAVNLKVIGPLNVPMGVDDFFLFELASPMLKLYYDGDISKGQEEGEVITVIIQNGAFVSALNSSSWSVEGLPDGIVFSNLTWIDSTMVQFQLEGSTSDYVEWADTIDLKVTVNADQFLASETDLSVIAGLVILPKAASHAESLIAGGLPGFRVYPNPTHSSLKIICSDVTEGHIELISAEGRSLLSRPVESPFMQLDLLPNLKGMYFLKLYSLTYNETQKVMIL